MPMPTHFEATELAFRVLESALEIANTSRWIADAGRRNAAHEMIGAVIRSRILEEKTQDEVWVCMLWHALQTWTGNARYRSTKRLLRQFSRGLEQLWPKLAEQGFPCDDE
jgi:hypothetical protein